MPHYTCKISKPGKEPKEISITGKDEPAALKEAQKSHPGFKVTELKLRPGVHKAAVKKILNSELAKKRAVEVVKAVPVPVPVVPNIQSPSTESIKIKPILKATTTTVDRLYYLQHGKCFYCGEYLARQDASLDHLLPKSHGGPNTDDNLVVCCKKLNMVFNDMSVKEKFKFVSSEAGNLICPSRVIQNFRVAEISTTPLK